MKLFAGQDTSPHAASGLPDWRRACGEPECLARIRRSPDDFRVTEIVDFALDGDGEHDWLWIQKTDTNTAWLARRLAAFAGVPARDVGYAGMKDRHAVTRQWFSVRRPGGDKPHWSRLELPGVRILTEARHSRKLRRGAHRGNAFALRLSAIDGDPRAPLERIVADGVPNYFGEQRFGRDGNNLALARSLFRGRRMRRDRRALALSAARAFLFNEQLAARVAAGSWNRLGAGDIANLDGTNSVFVVDGGDASLERRALRLDVHPTGALWGRDGDDAGACLLPAERQVVRAHPAFVAGLERHAAAARRPLRLKVDDCRFELDGDALRLEFSLRRGGFATAVLREIARYRSST